MPNSRVNHFKLFIPGPTPVADEVLAAMGQQVMGHRSADYKKLHASLRDRLKVLFQTQQRALLLTCSASVVMDALTRHCVRPDKRLVALSCGAFSERWGDMAQANGIQVDQLAWDWGQAYEPECLRAELEKGNVDAITLVHNETSTGVMNDLVALQAVVKDFPEVLVLVDTVSSLGATDIGFDRLELDACLAGVQKDLACPPGATVLALSDRFLERAREISHKSWALDLIEIVKKDDDDFSLSTPSLSHMFALLKRLEYMEVEGAQNRWERHRLMAQRARAWATEKFVPFVPEDFASATLTPVFCPEDFDPATFIKKIKEKTGFILGGGYGKLKKSTFRIAHMGECTLEDLENLLKAMDSCL